MLIISNSSLTYRGIHRAILVDVGDFLQKYVKASMTGDCGTGYKCRKCHHYWTEK